ncbi:Peptidase C1A, papain C-terminal [Sesbania bispinosa]|nr:Peptidase C1A, papain C-terminal [Sesbania bispinosa]
MDQNQYLLPLFLIIAIWGFKAMSRSLQEEASLLERHEQWMAKYGRVYDDDTAEKEKRFQIFKDNVDYIESFNAAGNKPYKLSINHFADQTSEEFKASLNGFKGIHGLRTTTATPFKYENVTDIPATIDWRKRGAVTPIKDQGQCSCWAFSAVAATEGILQLTSGKLVSLSEQELVDCDTNGDNQGCEGGYVEDAFEFIIENGGITTEANYPYKGVDGTCNLNKEASHIVQVKSYEKVPSNSEEALLKAVANQPVSVSVDAGGDFQFYSSGIFTGECGTELDHAVTVVGYGADNDDGTKYWIVKNSWGTEWGEEGYIRMKRDIDAKEGLCGIAMDASYPNINYVHVPNASGQASFSISLMHLLCKLCLAFVLLF